MEDAEPEHGGWESCLYRDGKVLTGMWSGGYSYEWMVIVWALALNKFFELADGEVEKAWIT